MGENMPFLKPVQNSSQINLRKEDRQAFLIPQNQAVTNVQHLLYLAAWNTTLDGLSKNDFPSNRAIPRPDSKCRVWCDISRQP